MKLETLEKLRTARVRRQAVALITNLEKGDQRLVAKDEARNDPLADRLDEAFRFDKSACQDGVFIGIYNPPLRLVIIGAVHIAQSVIPMAQLLGYDIAVIDPRGAFATGARFPGVSLHVEWPDDVIPKMGLDPRTAMIALTHDPKIDDPALESALKSGVFYIGALGSKKTQAARLERLKAKGFGESDFARIHGPIGLPIGAKGAPEIAVSIMAEMTRALRLGS